MPLTSTPYDWCANFATMTRTWSCSRLPGRTTRLREGSLSRPESATVSLRLWILRKCRRSLHAALEERSAEIENSRLRREARERNSFCELIGGSEAMQRVYDAIQRVAQSAVQR